MAKFGRFEFRESKPAETFEGDFMEQDKGYVNIFTGVRGLISFDSPHLIAALHLDKGQSIREIK